MTTTMKRRRSSNSNSKHHSSTSSTLMLCLVAIGSAQAFSLFPVQQQEPRGSIRSTTTSPLCYQPWALEEDAVATRTATQATTPIPQEQIQRFNQTLLAAGRDVDDAAVQRALTQLTELYEGSQQASSSIATSTMRPDARDCAFNEGDWELQTLPAFPGLLGYKEEDGSALFTMGRLTYNMILPQNDANLVCAVQKMTQHISKYELSDWKVETNTESPQILLPASLQREYEEDPRAFLGNLRRLRNDVHFTVEQHGVQGILQMDGFTLPNPTVPNRWTVWFTGGRCYADSSAATSSRNKAQQLQTWRRVFGTTLHNKTPWQLVQLWLAERIMGAEPAQSMQEDGSLRYVLKKPIGGHEQAYQQVLYMDDQWRITLGNKGTVNVVSRMAPRAAAVVNAQAELAYQQQQEQQQQEVAAAVAGAEEADIVKRIICSETLRAQQRIDSDTRVAQKMMGVFKKSAPKWLFEWVGA